MQPLPSNLSCTFECEMEDTDGKFADWYDRLVRQVEDSYKYNPEQEEAERQRLHEWNMKQVEEWNKTKEQKLEEMLAQTTKHVLLYCFGIDKGRIK